MGNDYNFRKRICEACIIHNENEINLVFDWSSYKERKGNALASGADEGRGKLRKAAGIGKHELIRRYPNGAIRMGSSPYIIH